MRSANRIQSAGLHAIQLAQNCWNSSQFWVRQGIGCLVTAVQRQVFLILFPLEVKQLDTNHCAGSLNQNQIIVQVLVITPDNQWAQTVPETWIGAMVVGRLETILGLYRKIVKSCGSRLASVSGASWLRERIPLEEILILKKSFHGHYWSYSAWNS